MINKDISQFLFEYHLNNIQTSLREEPRELYMPGYCLQCGSEHAVHFQSIITLLRNLTYNHDGLTLFKPRTFQRQGVGDVSSHPYLLHFESEGLAITTLKIYLSIYAQYRGQPPANSYSSSARPSQGTCRQQHQNYTYLDSLGGAVTTIRVGKAIPGATVLINTAQAIHWCIISFDAPISLHKVAT